ncbi:hypothetical protein QUB05_23980 [Microcoleus sp. F10-C6]|uniref:hypothetical protein n=1 Tax=Microcoleus sp. F10-B4 TaxID=2818753 RepID=UPI002FD09C9A
MLKAGGKRVSASFIFLNTVVFFPTDLLIAVSWQFNRRRVSADRQWTQANVQLLNYPSIT